MLKKKKAVKRSGEAQRAYFAASPASKKARTATERRGGEADIRVREGARLPILGGSRRLSFLRWDRALKSESQNKRVKKRLGGTTASGSEAPHRSTHRVDVYT